MQQTEVTLAGLANGGAVELFDRELARVLANIADPNTEPKTVRKITVEVFIKPQEDRESGQIAVRVASKLAPNKPMASTVYMGQQGGRLVAVTIDPRQHDMFHGGADVLPLTRKEAQS